MDEQQITDAAMELSDTVAMKLGELADRLTGRPEFGSNEWQREHTERDTPEGQQRLQRWHLVKLMIARQAGVNPVGDVINARQHGATWQAIADVWGVTRQAAYDRWGHLM